MPLHFGVLADRFGTRFAHEAVTSPSYVLHVVVTEFGVNKTLCGKPVGRTWARRRVLPRSECDTCVRIQGRYYT